jgi:hypothetical protein
MLFLDQPVQVGMSYDTLTNITTNMDTGAVKVANFSSGVPAQNASFYVGTYPSQNANLTTKGTENSARALWNFAQVWFQEFPQVSILCTTWARPATDISRFSVAQAQRRQNLNCHRVIRRPVRTSLCSILPGAEPAYSERYMDRGRPDSSLAPGHSFDH